MKDKKHKCKYTGDGSPCSICGLTVADRIYNQQMGINVKKAEIQNRFAKIELYPGELVDIEQLNTSCTDPMLEKMAETLENCFVMMRQDGWGNHEDSVCFLLYKQAEEILREYRERTKPAD